MKGRIRFFCLAVVACALLAALPTPALAAATRAASATDLLAGSKVVTQDGWLLVHLAGTPYQIGYQRGYLTPQLADYWIRSYLGPAGSGYRQEAREIAKTYVWPLIPTEYRQELKGEAAGLQAAVQAQGVALDDVAGLREQGYAADLWDLVAANDWADQEVYAARAKPGAKTALAGIATTGRCSAFIATGDATTDGQIVMGHNTWCPYDEDFMYNVIYDVHPQKGHAFRYQGTAGAIWSGEDWYVNDAGLMVCETSLTDAASDPTGSPVFIRIRRAVQYAGGIDGFLKVMLARNNGAYPNEWLVGDAKTGEIASLQLGCKVYDLARTHNGFFTSSNYAWGADFQQEAGRSKPLLKSYNYARYVRWGQLKDHYYGRVDAEVGEALLSDTYDVYLQRDYPSSRTICGEWEKETIGQAWPEGAYDGKVTTSGMVLHGMKMWARWGHPNGDPFDARAFMAANQWWVSTHDDFAMLGLTIFDSATPQPWSLVARW